MYFCIQELQTKKQVKGYPKSILIDYKDVDGMRINTYKFSDDCFDRTIKKAYRITLHESYREKGKVKKYQYVVCTLNYYTIAESYEDECNNFLEDSLWEKITNKLDAVIDKLEEQKLEMETEQRDDLYNLLADKVNPLFDNIIAEFKKTNEYKEHEIHRKKIQEYKYKKQHFMKEYDALGIEYDICFDLDGNLTNREYFEKVKNRSYQKSEKDTHHYVNTPSYTNREREILKQFYRILGKTFHPDSNVGIDTTEQMKLINKLKSDWNL